MLDDWDIFLTTIEFSYNNYWQETIWNTPIFLNIGQHPMTPMSRINICQVLARKNGFQAHVRCNWFGQKTFNCCTTMEKYYATEKRREISSGVDQQAHVSTANTKLKVPSARKLLSQWIGPFRITKRTWVVAYHVQL